MKNVFVIKTGASGDVVRTTIILHLFKNCNIHWLTKTMNASLLPQNLDNLNIYEIENFNVKNLPNIDIIVSLDDDFNCATIAASIPCKKLYGAFINDDGKVSYTKSRWFDMGLISKFGKATADEMKKANQETFHTLMYEMLDAKYNNEEYWLREDVQHDPSPKLIGLESRAGGRWPTKVWNNYKALQKKLEENGFKTVVFEERTTMKEYMQDISKCELVVTGDSLAMHLSLALKIKTVAIFTCTSATEIYGYNRMSKIVSPLLFDAFYTNDYREDVLNAISVDEVYNEVINLYNKKPMIH